jgi:hypothetical protein
MGIPARPLKAHVGTDAVQSHDMLYKVSRDILYSGDGEDSSRSQRSTIVDPWLPRSALFAFEIVAKGVGALNPPH